jgi:hypothetical protein
LDYVVTPEGVVSCGLWRFKDLKIEKFNDFALKSQFGPEASGLEFGFSLLKFEFL